MTTRHLNAIPLVLFLAACGGSDFTSAGLEQGSGAGPGGAPGGGDAAAAGGVTGVTGGSGGVTASAGGAGPGTGGTGSGGRQGASGGASAGTGGVVPEAGGAGSGGVQGASGGSPATGGGTGTCNPPTVTPESLPQQIVWESFSSRVTAIPVDQCLSCQHSPCTTCSVVWWPVTQSADGLTLTASASVTCGPVDVSLVACGSDPSASSCTTWPGVKMPVELIFGLLPKADGTGYTLTYRSVSGGYSLGFDGQPYQGSCPDIYNQAARAQSVQLGLFYALRDSVVATEWPCGS